MLSLVISNGNRCGDKTNGGGDQQEAWHHSLSVSAPTWNHFGAKSNHLQSSPSQSSPSTSPPSAPSLEQKRIFQLPALFLELPPRPYAEKPVKLQHNLPPMAKVVSKAIWSERQSDKNTKCKYKIQTDTTERLKLKYIEHNLISSVSSRAI